MIEEKSIKYKYILFDLDGTLIDSEKGITKSVKYALEKFGIDDYDRELLKTFIGPPLKESFMTKFDFSEEKSELAIKYYRENFSRNGVLDNDLYKGVKKLLNDLKSRGVVIALATSKPTVFAKQILDNFRITEFFEVIVGSNLDGTRTLKKDVIEEVINQLNILDLKDMVMIGDRKHDIIGANYIGVDSIGVTYGFGSHKELVTENPLAIVESVDELNHYLIDYLN